MATAAAAPAPVRAHTPPRLQTLHAAAACRLGLSIAPRRRAARRARGARAERSAYLRCLAPQASPAEASQAAEEGGLPLGFELLGSFATQARRRRRAAAGGAARRGGGGGAALFTAAPLSLSLMSDTSLLMLPQVVGVRYYNGTVNIGEARASAAASPPPPPGEPHRNPPHAPNLPQSERPQSPADGRRGAGAQQSVRRLRRTHRQRSRRPGERHTWLGARLVVARRLLRPPSSRAHACSCAHALMRALPLFPNADAPSKPRRSATCAASWCATSPR